MTDLEVADCCQTAAVAYRALFSAIHTCFGAVLQWSTVHVHCTLRTLLQ